MGYRVIKKVDLNYENDGIELVRYAILENNGSVYLQVKLKNVSDTNIKSLKLIYNCYGARCIHNINFESCPGEEFYDKNLIEVESEDVEVLEIRAVKKVKEKKESDDDFFEKPQKQKIDISKKIKEFFSEPIFLWSVSLIVFLVSVIIWVIYICC